MLLVIPLAVPEKNKVLTDKQTDGQKTDHIMVPFFKVRVRNPKIKRNLQINYIL